MRPLRSPVTQAPGLSRRSPATRPIMPPATRSRSAAAAGRPDETVTIVLHRDPFLHPDVVLTSVADAGGTITNTSFAPRPDDIDVTFFVTATGSQSGLQATATFRGAKPTWTGAVSDGLEHRRQLEPAGVPDSNDNVTIPASVASGRYPVVSSTPHSPSNVTLAAGGGTQPSLTVSGGTLTRQREHRDPSRNVERVRRDTPHLRGLGRQQRRHGQRLRQRRDPHGECHRSVPSDNIILCSRRDVQSVRRHGGHQGLRPSLPAPATSSRAAPSASTTTSGTPGSSTRRPAHSSSPAAASGNAFNCPGTNQFFNVVVAAASPPTSPATWHADILVRGDWTMNGTADLSVTR